MCGCVFYWNMCITLQIQILLSKLYFITIKSCGGLAALTMSVFLCSHVKYVLFMLNFSCAVVFILYWLIVIIILYNKLYMCINDKKKFPLCGWLGYKYKPSINNNKKKFACGTALRWGWRDPSQLHTRISSQWSATSQGRHILPSASVHSLVIWSGRRGGGGGGYTHRDISILISQHYTVSGIAWMWTELMLILGKVLQASLILFIHLKSCEWLDEYVEWVCGMSVHLFCVGKLNSGRYVGVVFRDGVVLFCWCREFQVQPLAL